jgi:hypothetical protein
MECVSWLSEFLITGVLLDVGHPCYMAKPSAKEKGKNETGSKKVGISAKKVL